MLQKSMYSFNRTSLCPAPALFNPGFNFPFSSFLYNSHGGNRPNSPEPKAGKQEIQNKAEQAGRC